MRCPARLLPLLIGKRAPWLHIHFYLIFAGDTGAAIVPPESCDNLYRFHDAKCKEKDIINLDR